MNNLVCYGIIPARFASTRFPGKPLADILGKPMFWHVYTRAKQCPHLAEVVLATDDRRIADAADNLGVPFIMTRDDHESGSDRIFEAAQKLNLADDAVLVNIQGDEPALDPAVISALVRPFFSDTEVAASTLAHPLSETEAANPNRVKVVLTLNNNALYFSRSPIPFPRNPDSNPGSIQPAYLGHIGIYAYTFATLKKFTSLSPSPLEKLEGLEQLRFLENNIPIRVATVSKPSQAVDIPEDVAKVEQILLAAKNPV